MPKSQINVRLDQELIDRLDTLARRTGRTKTFYAQQAIRDFLEEREDYYLAKDSLAEFIASGEEAVSLDDINWPEGSE
jgi:RHH-type rel operon transcriptional repressor/antitoxin RelB